ncbi:lytic murein transglycosylase [Avibacterium paragallinarum]|uniref:Lytic murein transglycosylase n=1 Tax=Avibacterium paragallinarum TaxID=728 RepID=A0AAE5THL3_AVIPA|nr:lytic murein transglycosylase [Avibacterium paragallinarum]MEE3608692.1 lytic murein transglycosylase [Avibacterium paragallinarum]MEE3622236.1 lytic murein transglycosylase [Avibacterium paragallinarum]MEE3669901.1 lytic murein transglycosylase [Avibacterium paragallinarum]MEE3681043.1 lytic murein transglycosylase [Avibacterium paragallinarum]MEE4385725.1 lytic murein transglycosylase [Avibacterium paragallinarum]
MFKRKLLLSSLFSVILLAGCSSSHSIKPINENAQYNKPRTLNNFEDYVAFLKGKAAGQGVSSAVLNAQQNIQYMPKAVALDKQQAGKAKKRNPNEPKVLNPNGVTRYLNRVLTTNKVKVAEQRYWEQLPQLEKASQKFGVQKAYLMALWGMESSFGYYQGYYDVLSALATLAFDGRREALFSKEFIAAMKMLERDHIQRSKMKGSWAGAMGQTQFMPSSYLSYAADGDNDGEKDIWKNHYDVFASIANYLHTVGWDDKLPWGVEVRLNQFISPSFVGVEKQKARSLQDWQALGVTLKTFTPKTTQNLTALSQAKLWLVQPDGEAGRAFLVSNNFRTLLDWNRSQYFAVSIGMFANRIKTRVM